MIVQLKNIGRSPRGVHNIKGTCVVIMPGQSKPVNLDEGGLALVRKMGGFQIYGAPQTVTAGTNLPGSGGSSGLVIETLEQLRAKAESLGIKVDNRWKEKRLREEINAVHASNSGESEE